MGITVFPAYSVQRAVHYKQHISVNYINVDFQLDLTSHTLSAACLNQQV